MSNGIPKIIHYCWFGGTTLPKSAMKCIESWKKYCPEYDIKEWNETNFDLNCCAYVREAYEAKKWAFVSDYARYWILYHQGGLYFDTDVELIRPINDIVEKGPFMGCESVDSALLRKVPLLIQSLGLAANPGLGLAANPGLEFYKKMLDFYNSKHFIKQDGSLDTTTIVIYTTDLLLKNGFMGSGEIELVEDIYIYPPDYFCPLNYYTGRLVLTDNSRTIHHYLGSWLDKPSQIINGIAYYWSRYGMFGKIIAMIVILPLKVWRKITKWISGKN